MEPLDYSWNVHVYASLLGMQETQGLQDPSQLSGDPYLLMGPRPPFHLVPGGLTFPV